MVKRNKFSILSQCRHLFLCILEVPSNHSIVQVTRNGIVEEEIFDPCCHFVPKGERYFQRLYLKLFRSRNAKVKRFSKPPTRIVITPDETYDTYVDFSDYLELDIYVYNMPEILEIL